MSFHYFGALLCEAFCRGQLLSNQVTFDHLSLLWRVTLGRGQLLSDRISFDDFSLLWGLTLGSLPSGTAA